MILDLILISLRTRKKVLLWSSKNSKQNIFKLINYRQIILIRKMK
jgi:hypothetical protein